MNRFILWYLRRVPRVQRCSMNTIRNTAQNNISQQNYSSLPSAVSYLPFRDRQPTTLDPRLTADTTPDAKRARHDARSINPRRLVNFVSLRWLICLINPVYNLELNFSLHASLAIDKYKTVSVISRNQQYVYFTIYYKMS